MANIGSGTSRVIIDPDGEAATVTNNKLDVNATLVAGATIDIGDVDMFLDGGTAVLGGAGDVAAGVLRVTLASDDPAVVSLDEIESAIEAIEGAVDGSYLNVNMNLAGSDAQAGEGTITATTQRVTIATDDDGVAHLATIAGAVDTQLQVDVVAISGQSDGTYIGDIKFGESLPAGTNAIGKLAANSGVDIGDVDVTSISAGTNIIGKVSHDITGGADGVKTVSSAGTDVVLGGHVDCKKIDILAQTDNTGLIAVGFTGVDATEATGTGVILYAGDTYSLEMVNLNLIYIDSTVSGEGVRYTYFT